MGAIFIWAMSLLGFLAIPLLTWARRRPEPMTREEYDQKHGTESRYSRSGSWAYGEYKDSHEFRTNALVVLAAVAVLISLVTWGVRGIVEAVQNSDRATCAHRAERRGVGHDYLYIGGGSYECLVKAPDGRWVPIGELDATVQVNTSAG